MKKILLIDAEAREDGVLVEELRTAGVEVRVASGGLYALTMLERERPDLIASRADLGDMVGTELCAMVKRDFSMASTRVVLLARDLEEKLRAEREEDFDQVLLAEDPPTGLAGDLLRCLDPPREPVVAEPHRPQVISGSLGVLSFAELTQAFSQTGKTGRLVLDAEAGRGEVLFARGRIRHACFGPARGAAAFGRLFRLAERSANTTFRFEPLTAASLSRQPRTLDLTAQQLLLSAAVQMDEAGRAEGSAPTPRPGLLPAARSTPRLVMAGSAAHGVDETDGEEEDG